MKKLFVLLIGLAAATTSHSQAILTYKSHGLIPNEKNPMMLAKYVDPGIEGPNAVWDFTLLEATDNFTGNIQDSYTVKNAFKFESANTVLEEFGNYFFFSSNSSQLEQYGYSSGNGSLAIEYSKPFVKMRYPFTFNNYYSGSFEGKYILNNTIIGDIVGTYKVSGDATGKLLLPNGKSFNNALRVKEVKNYKQTVNGSSINIEEVAHRWYVNEHRFPILVLINSTYTFGNGQTSSSTKSAYNTNVITLSIDALSQNNGLKLDVFPNPYHEKVNINLHLDTKSMIRIAAYDLTGKRVALLADNYADAGDLSYTFSAKEIGLPKGTYIIKVKVNNDDYTKKIVEL
jgi:hypothetical protein